MISPPIKASFLLMLSFGVFATCASGQQTKTALQQSLAAGMEAQQAGNYIEAERIFLAAIEKAKQSSDPHLAGALELLANLYQHEGKGSNALDCLKQALAVDEATFGPQHLRVAMDLNNLAIFYEGSDQAEAEKAFKRGLDILDNLPEPQRSQRFIIINNLSQFYTLRQHRYAESETLLKSAVEDLENSPLPNGVELGRMRHLLATVYEKEGKDSDAEALKGDADTALQPGENPHLDPAFLALRRAESYRRSERFEDAEASYHEAISTLENARTDKTRGPGYPWFLPAALDGLGEVYVAEKRDAEAEDAFKRAFDLCEQYASTSKQGRSFARNIRFPHGLLSLYRTEGRLNEMEPVFARALAVEERVLGPQDSVVGETSILFARLYHEEGKNEEAVPLYQRALEIQEKNEGESIGLVVTLEDYAGLLQALNEEDGAAAVRSRAKTIRSQLAAAKGTQ